MVKVNFKSIKEFGRVGRIGVHRILESERDIDEALYSCDRDGFKDIYFYISFPPNWMNDCDFMSALDEAKFRVNQYNEALNEAP